MTQRLCLLALLLACHGPEPATTPASAVVPPDEPVTASANPPASPPTPPIDPTRPCGEAGREPTELPDILLTGLAPHGEGVLHPNEKRTHGTVVLEYDPDKIVTPTNIATVREPVLTMICDPDEVPPRSAYGTHTELRPDSEFHLTIGPYRVDARTSADLQEVTYKLGRRPCPDSAVIPASNEPVALWLSTEGIRVHTYDLPDRLLQVILDARGDNPRLDVSNLAYKQYFEPRPGEVRSFRVGDRRVTIDRVLPGPNTRFESGKWIADGDARLHARVRIDLLPAPPQPPPVTASSPCGDASPVRTTLPALLTDLPRAQGDVIAKLGKPQKLRGLTFTLTEQTIASPVYRRPPETYQSLAIHRGDKILHNLSLRWGALALHRLDRELLRVDPSSPPPQARVRRYPLPCSAEHVVPVTKDPLYVWLSTAGHRHVRVGTADIPPLSLSLYEDVQYPTLGASSANAHLSSYLQAQHLGAAFTLDGYEVEIVDIVPAGDTRRATHGWQSSNAAPALHVQVRVEPSP